MHESLLGNAYEGGMCRLAHGLQVRLMQLLVTAVLGKVQNAAPPRAPSSLFASWKIRYRINPKVYFDVTARYREFRACSGTSEANPITFVIVPRFPHCG